MVTKKIWLGMLVLVLAFGLTLVGCDNDGGGDGGGSTGLAGTWVSGNDILELTNTTFEVRYNEGAIYQIMRGNYSTSGNNMTVTPTHIHGYFLDFSGWLSENDLRNWGFSQAEISEMLAPWTGTYSLSGNTLIITMEGITMEGDTAIYTRQ